MSMVSRLHLNTVISLASFLLFACGDGHESAGVANATQDMAYPKEITGPLGIEFVRIPAGTFVMGCDGRDRDCSHGEMPDFKVTISKPFYMSKYEITQAQWEAVLGKNDNTSTFKGKDHPVENVTWLEVTWFISILNNSESVLKYRLPTEAEWEYAARAGTATKYWFGDDTAGLDESAWYDDNAEEQTHPVGQKKPNPWGLYDMYGNVAEWVRDWYDHPEGRRRVKSHEIDPHGPANLPLNTFDHVIRGGDWNSSAQVLRSSRRNAWSSKKADDKTGFRLVFNPDERDSAKYARMNTFGSSVEKGK
jgi:formylglycine-generating enzyme required for sulfatase activity